MHLKHYNVFSSAKRKSQINLEQCSTYLGMEFDIKLDKCPPSNGDKDWTSHRLVDLPLWRDSYDISIPQFHDENISEHLLLWIMSPYRWALYFQ